MTTVIFSAIIEYNKGAVCRIFWLGLLIWATADGDISPSFFLHLEFVMSILSIFVDESGDFGKLDKTSPYYLVTLVFHDQSNSIKEQLEKLDESMRYEETPHTYIHTGPLIRREYPYVNMSIDERRHLLFKLRSFFVNAPIHHYTLVINKREITDSLSLGAAISKSLKALVNDNLEYFNSFEKIIVYYDNGQMELNSVLNSAMNIMFQSVEFRKASPNEYRLLQTANFVCSFKLLEIKQSEKRLSKSEEQFFYKPQELKKSFIKTVNAKTLKTQ